MNYLLDTHTLIWSITEKKKLSSSVKKIVEDTDNVIFASSISFWEISLKFALKKFEFTGFLPEELPQLAIDTGFNIIPLLAEESASFYRLPVSEFHKDPFDRMLIWQAINKNMILLSKDKNAKLYHTAGLKSFW